MVHRNVRYITSEYFVLSITYLLYINFVKCKFKTIDINAIMYQVLNAMANWTFMLIIDEIGLVGKVLI